MKKLLFRTVHGSHLYGLAHAKSDMDWYEVYDQLPGRRKASQSIVGADDTVRISLNEFMRQVGIGVPQALETLFAPDSAVEIDNIRWLRSGLVPGTAMTANCYRRTISAHLHGESNPKRRRHAARLTHDLDMLLATGHMDPTAFSRTDHADIGLYAS